MMRLDAFSQKRQLGTTIIIAAPACYRVTQPFATDANA
jgi:hypothetical protein